MGIERVLSEYRESSGCSQFFYFGRYVKERIRFCLGVEKTEMKS